MKIIRLPVLILVVLLACGNLSALVLAQGSRASSSSDYPLGPGDLLEISVFGVENFHFTRRVSASGFITLPYVNKIYVAGLTVPELEEKLTLLLDGRFIRNPQVSVFVSQYQSQSVVILGAVNEPGLYEIARPLNLLDVIALAGGLKTDRAADQATIYRNGINLSRQAPEESQEEVEDNRGSGKGPNPESGLQTVAARNSKDPKGDQSILTVNLRALFEENALSQNIPIEGGDIIYIPEKLPSRFYVIGEVMSPGAYAMPDEQVLLVSQAMALAGGPIRTAKMNKGVLVRYDGTGRREELQVNFSDILKGRKPDFAIKPDDIIFIPGSTIKSIGYGLLGIIPSVATQTVIRTP